MKLQQSERLLNYLKTSPLLDGYCFSVYSDPGTASPDRINRHLCGARGIPHLCHKICLPSLNASVEEALLTGRSVFFLCPLGLLSFAVPLSSSSCLVCSGMRENLFDLYFYRAEQLENLKERNIYPFELLEQLEKLPVSTEKEVRETMLKVERLVKSFVPAEELPAVDPSASLTSSFMNVAAAMDGAENLDKAIALFSETLGILFDIPAIALVLRDEESGCCTIECCWGTVPTPSYLADSSFPFRDGNHAPADLTGAEVRALFPGCKSDSALCLPLYDGDAFYGMAVLFDATLTPGSLSLSVVLAGRLVERLKGHVESRAERRQKRVVSLLDMIRKLSLTENQDELLRLIVEMAAELVDAANGSLMVIDKKSGILHVVAALGIHPAVARSLTARIGEGIAGRVAVSGSPILVTDIEKEQGLGRGNRIRFGTKSCISLPLWFKGVTIGVLNLADKKSSAPFTPADQDILSVFTEQATIILGRSSLLKKARMNSVFDPETGLYTIRYLKKRFDEELSRSLRHNLQLSLVIARIFPSSEKEGAGCPPLAAKSAARVLGSSLRDIDLLGRSGEAEFCMVLPSTPVREGAFVAQRIRHALEKELGGDIGPSSANGVTIGVGIASFPEDGASAVELIKIARARCSRDPGVGIGKVGGSSHD